MRGAPIMAILTLPACLGTAADATTTGGGAVANLSAPPRPGYGFWGLNGFTSQPALEDLHRRFGMTVFQTAMADPVYAVTTLLPMAKAAGVHVTLRMTKDHESYTQNGDFDLVAWKHNLDPWAHSGVQKYIDDGTLVGHMLLDDITNFDGHDPNAAEIDAMAQYSKQLLPGLMTYVRERATVLPTPDGGQYIYLDAAVNQYKAAHGDVNTWAEVEAGRAKLLGINVINGLNIANGGDGSSGKAGWGAGHFAMSAAEITRYGTVLANVPTCGMFLNWEYDGQEKWSDGTVGIDYFNQEELQTALAQLGALVAAHPHVELLKPPTAGAPVDREGRP